MGYYKDKVSLRGGRILLYQIEGSKKGTWQARFKVRGLNDPIVKSTRETRYDEAVIWADEEYDRLQNRVNTKAPIHDWTFREHWEDWYNRKCLDGSWKDERKGWHKGVYNRYFDPYFGDHKLNELDKTKIDDYWMFRLGYWVTGEGADKRKENPQRRNSAKRPAAKTLQMELVALRQILRDAHQRRRMIFLPIVERSDAHKGRGIRPGFDEHEWLTFQSNLENFRLYRGRFEDRRANAFHRLRRGQIYLYIMFMANTGLRVGEAREMRWEDVSEFEDLDAQTKLKIRVRENTKRGARTAISQPNAVNYIRRWKELSPATSAQDYVWIGQGTDKDGKAKKSDSFNKTFQTILANIPYKDRPNGLLDDANGTRRTVYSLRHYYATTRILHGNVDIYDLALNMGTSTIEIERTYSKVLAEQRSVQITRMRPKKKPPAQRKLQDDLISAIDEGHEDLAKVLLTTLLDERKEDKK